jgi:hypothetical protein
MGKPKTKKTLSQTFGPESSSPQVPREFKNRRAKIVARRGVRAEGPVSGEKELTFYGPLGIVRPMESGAVDLDVHDFYEERHAQGADNLENWEINK